MGFLGWASFVGFGASDSGSVTFPEPVTPFQFALAARGPRMQTIADLLDEAQDLLLGQGNAEAMSTSALTIRKQLARRCPVLTTITQTQTRWVFGTFSMPNLALDEHAGAYTDRTAAVQEDGGGTPVEIGQIGDGYLIGAYGLFEELLLEFTAPVGGAAGLYTFAYWDGADWRQLALLGTPFATAATTHRLRWLPPDDWERGRPVETLFPEAIDPAQFWVRMQGTAVPESIPPVLQVSVQTAIYPLPAGVIDLLAILWMPQELEPASVREGLDLENPLWFLRDAAVPVRYTNDLADLERLRLVPRPQTQGLPNAPWGPGLFAPDNLVMCATVDHWELPDTPLWAEGIYTYLVAAYEARRLGETRNEFVAQHLEVLSSGLIALLHQLWREEGLELPQPWQSPMRLRGEQ